MPEGDRFERSFGAGWRGAFQLVRGGFSSDGEIADKLVGSLAKTLRNEKGVPGFAEMYRVIVEGKKNSLLQAFNALDDIVRDNEGHGHTQVAADVAKSLLVQQDASNGMAASETLERRLAEGTCSALMDHYFFARAYPQLIDEGRFFDHEDARQWRHRVEQAIQGNVAKLADRLAERPDAEGLRTPKRIVPKESTRKLLQADLLTPVPKEPVGLPL